MKKIITDTNVLMDDHRILNKLSEKYDQIQIPLTVLKELDKHKFNPDLSYSARKAIHAILDFKEKYKDKIKFIVNDFEVSDNDLKIIKSAEVEGADIATKDISMSLIANSKGIETILYDVIVNNLFKPYIKLKIEEVSSFLNFEQSYIEEKYEDIFERINIISNENKLRKNGWMFIFLYDNDIIPEVIYAHNPIKKEIIRIDNNPLYREIEIESGMKVKALDEYQLCAFYAFKEAPNILLTGKWGTGKTLLSTAYSIEKSKRKIFISRPPIGINKKYDIGYLPGSADEKMFSWFAGILSSIYYLYSNTRNQKMKDVEYDYVKDKVFPSKFETIPLNAIQGMSLLNDDILLIDEVQLIDIDYLSMILSRSGKNSKTILLGDVKQTYGVVKPSESGLLKLLRLLPHENLAYVDLQIPYRSSLLELADKLQDSIIM